MNTLPTSVSDYFSSPQGGICLMGELLEYALDLPLSGRPLHASPEIVHVSLELTTTTLAEPPLTNMMKFPPSIRRLRIYYVVSRHHRAHLEEAWNLM